MTAPRVGTQTLVLAGVALILISTIAEAAELSLRDAVVRALEYAPTVDQARAQSDFSHAKVREQFAPLLPGVQAGTEYYQAPGYNPIITNRGLSAGMVALNYTAWDWGKRTANWRAAKYANEIAALGVIAARAQTVFDTIVAYDDLVRARAAERELGENLDRLSRYVATVQQLRTSGRAIANDVLKIQSARDSAELALSQARSSRQLASTALGSMFGEGGSDNIAIDDSIGMPEKPEGQLAQSPALVAAQRAISAASQQVDAAEAARLPTFQVALTTGFLGIDPPETARHDYGASYDGVISVPLFQGGLLQSQIDQAKAKEHSAKAQLRETQYLLARRVTDATLRYDQARNALALLDRATPTANDAFALTWTRFLGGGQATILEVLDAYQQAEQLRLAAIDQQFAAREAAAEVSLLNGHAEAP